MSPDGWHPTNLVCGSCMGPVMKQGGRFCCAVCRTSLTTEPEGISGWHFTEHACRHCTGPVMHKGDQFACAACHVTSLGEPSGICGCGLQSKGPDRKRSGFRCVPNPAKSPASPAAVVIEFDGSERRVR